MVTELILELHLKVIRGQIRVKNSWQEVYTVYGK